MEVSTQFSFQFSCATENQGKDLFKCKWLGLDQHKTIAYCISLYNHPNSSSAIIELKKLCLFTRKISKIKEIFLPNDLFHGVPSFAGRSATINKNGDIIGVALKSCTITRIGGVTSESIKFLLCFFKIKTGTYRIYQINNFSELFNGALCKCQGFLLLLNKAECILKFNSSGYKRKYYCSITLDDKTGEAFLTIIGEYAHEEGGWIVQEMFLNDKIFSVYSVKGVMTKIHILNVETKQLKKLPVSNEPNIPVIKYPIVFTQSDKLMAFSNKPEPIFLKYDEEENMWQRMCVMFKNPGFNPKYVYGASGFAVLLEGYQIESKCVVKNITNVLTLKDICFLNFVNVYTKDLMKLPEKSIYCDVIAELPSVILRRYFGPILSGV